MVIPHHISVKGWGLAVPLLTVFWIIFVVAGMLIIDAAYPDTFYTPDKAEAEAGAYRMMSAAFALSAASVLFVSLRRQRAHQRATTPLGPDEFMYLPLRFYPYFLAASALGMFIYSFSPSS